MALITQSDKSFENRPHILVVDDDARIRKLVSRFLEDRDFVTLTARDAAQARDILERFSFDAMVLDVMMPGETGLQLAEFVLKQYRLPVLLLTALGEAADRISGLEVGADDYLTKPFEPQELVLRLQAILRRSGTYARKEGRPLRIGEWVFDPVQNVLESEEKTLPLTVGEANLLKALARTPGEAVSRENLAIACGLQAGERTIDVQVTRLRRKMEKDTRRPIFLQTARGKGYLLRIDNDNPVN